MRSTWSATINDCSEEAPNRYTFCADDTTRAVSPDEKMGVLDALDSIYRLATSKVAQRTAVNAVLLLGASISLFGLAGLASMLFYNNYLPDQLVTLPIYLQYGSGPNPYGVAALDGSTLKDRQEYDVSVALTLPPSPANLERGNFMVALYFMTQGGISQQQTAPYMPPEPYKHFNGKSVIFSSRRPALIPYHDPIASLASRTMFLLYHMLFPASQTRTLVIPMAERVEFPGASSIPASVYVEVQAGQTIEVYRASVTMTAQLRGLRWLMVNYRLATFTILTIMFWICEVSFMCAAWLLLVSQGAAKEEVDLGIVKNEKKVGVGIEDAPATFPTYGRQPPLRYEPRIKDEEHESRPLESIAPAGAEADDEEDEEEEKRMTRRGDSGIGTSYSEGTATVHLRRRSSHQR